VPTARWRSEWQLPLHDKIRLGAYSSHVHSMPMLPQWLIYWLGGTRHPARIDFLGIRSFRIPFILGFCLCFKRFEGLTVFTVMLQCLARFQMTASDLHDFRISKVFDHVMNHFLHHSFLIVEKTH
jgi:hypothetical protein